MGFSQDSTLTPDKVIIQGKDTLFAWKLYKCRSMAKYLVKYSYCDSIRNLQSNEINTMDSAIATQARMIDILYGEKKDQGQMISIKEKQLAISNLTIQSQKKVIRRQKGLKIAGFSLAGLLGLIAIMK